MAFNLPAPTSDTNTDAKVVPVWANFRAIAAFIANLAGTPTGTGFIHVTGGVQDAAAVSLIKTNQQGTVTIAVGSATGTATLSPSVVLANSFILWLGESDDQATFNPQKALARLSFTATTVTATRNTTTTDTVIVAFQVVEFN